MSDQAPEQGPKKIGVDPSRPIGRNNPPAHSVFQTGNPGGPGRPQGSVSIVKYLKAALEAKNDAKAKKLAASLIKQFMEGNSVAVKQVLDRIDGVPDQKIIHEITDGTVVDAASIAVAMLERDLEIEGLHERWVALFQQNLESGLTNSQTDAE